MGESGSGKTTLLNILATLDTPTGGEVLLDGENLAAVSKKNAAAFRRERLGFIFQDFNLLDSFSVKDNILLPLVLSGISVKEMERRLTPIAMRLNIGSLLEKFPYEISGGQKQRALITKPKLILADEPTGALDSRSAANLLEILTQINETGQTILMVTHSVQAASHAGRVLFLRDGAVFHEIYRGDMSHAQMHKIISDTLVVANRDASHA